MKNLLILIMTALFLFSLSAALSLWLNQSRLTPDGQAEKDKDKDKAAPKSGEPKEGDAKTPPRKTDTPTPGPDASANLTRDQEAKLARRALQIELILQDIQSQREATDALMRQVAAELKTATAKTAELDAQAADLQKKKNELTAAERKNFEKMAAVYDAMTPEGAAPILKQMAESGPGKMDTVAQILVLMKERNAARVLEAMGDVTLAGQLMDRVRGLKPPGAPAPAPVTPPARNP